MYLGYSGIVLRVMGTSVAFDVADLLKEDEVRAFRSLDILLFTHGHGDHYKSKETLELFHATGAQVLAENSVAKDLAGKIPADKLTVAEPGKTYQVGRCEIRVVTGIHRGPIVLYQLSIGKSKIFHGGDSGYVPLKDYSAELAFLPTGSPSPTASPDEALKMALDLKPRLVLTMHGSEAQCKEFEKNMKDKMPNTTVIIPEPYEPKKVSLM